MITSFSSCFLVCVCAHAANMWRPEVDITCPQSLSTYFSYKSLSEHINSLE